MTASLSLLRRRRPLRLAVAGLVGAGAGAGLTAGALASPAAAVSPDIVISQVYGGGGNSGATFTHDFIELHNRGSAPVNLAGWSVQYASAAGSSWQVTPLAGVVAPGTYYLVQEAAGAGGTTPLPTPDATGSTAMSATAAKVALRTTTAALSSPPAVTCRSSTPPPGTPPRRSGSSPVTAPRT